VKPRNLLFFAFLIGLAGCSATVTSELVPKKTATYFESFRGFNIDSQNFDYLSTEAAIWVTSASGLVDTTQRSQLGQGFQAALGKAGFFPVFLNDIDISDRLAENRVIRKKTETFLDTLNSVTVSDKDLANPVGAFLGVNDFLVFHVAHWPCPSCEKQQKVRIKVRLVDASTGLIVWTATAQRDTYQEDNPMEVAQELSEELSKMFQQRFELKWHKLRYLNLTKS